MTNSLASRHTATCRLATRRLLRRAVVLVAVAAWCPVVVHAQAAARASAAAALPAAALPAAALPAAASPDAAPPAAAPPALVLVVRHAEKVDNSNDPALSDAGMARARALAEALVDAKIDHVIVTHRQRTRLTAAPAMSARGITPQEIAFGASTEAHVADVAAAARAQSGKVVLIVGHSNTVPAIVHALGGPKMPDLCDARYASLFAVVPGAVGADARVVVSSFGAPDAPGAMSCAGMIPR